MKKNIFIVSNNGFSLLEITIVLIIISVLLSSVIPVLSRTFLENAAKKTALDISSIQDASRKFYIDYNKWPDAGGYSSPIANLQALGYLPSGWSAKNPFVNYEPDLSDFSYYISTNSSSLRVNTNVPTDAQPIIENLLPAASVDPSGSGHNVYSSISVPGEENVIPTGTILAWTSSTLPGGFLWCNGQAVSRSNYSNLFTIIGTTYGAGDGSTTFNLPDTMGRVIVGVDGMGGATPANRITQWSAAPATFGGTFGEDAHRQSITEMAPHTHPYASWNYVKGFSGNSTTSPRDPQGGTTGSAGGNGDGTGLGAPANIIQPSIALGCIIKY